MRQILLKLKLVVGKWFLIEINYESGRKDDEKFT